MDKEKLDAHQSADPIDSMDESNLADHLLPETSLEKRKRNSDKYMHFLVENMNIDFMITMMIDEALDKYQEEREYYSNLQHIDEIALFFKNLEEIYNENKKQIIRLSDTQLNDLKFIQTKIEYLFNQINHAILFLQQEIHKIQTELSHDKNRLREVQAEYYALIYTNFSKAFASNDFQTIIIDISKSLSNPSWVGSIYINQEQFQLLGNNIIKQIVKMPISRDSIHDAITQEAENYLRSHINQALQNEPKSIIEVLESDVFTQGIETITMQIHKQMNTENRLQQIQDKINEYDALMNKIKHGEQAHNYLEMKLETFNKCKEALEAASDINLKIIENKTSHAPIYNQLINFSGILLQDIANKTELNIDNINFSFSQESENTAVNTPRIR